MSDAVKERYGVDLGDLTLDVEVKLAKKELVYNVVLPVFEGPTKAFMNTLRERLALEGGAKMTELGDKAVVDALREKFGRRIDGWISQEIPSIDEDARRNMRASILNASLGLGNIEFLLRDRLLEEIVINSSKEPVRVYHKKYGWLKTNIRVDTEGDIQNYSKAIARSVGKEVTIGAPMLDAHLPNGDRINSVLYPVSDKGTSMTIRMFARDPWTFTDFVANRTLTPELLSLFWLLVQYELNILISGGTGSGKTSLLNILMPFIQPNHRIVSIEDTRELQLPEFLYWCPMKTRSANQQGEGEINMSDLLINSLRMRPDRIVLGEIRKGMDAEILFEAMHTGHSVYATIHADTSSQTLRRLVNPPLNVPPVMVEAIHLNVVMYRDRKRGIRRAFQVSEIIPKENIGSDTTLSVNTLYKWKARTDEITSSSEDIRLFQEVSLHTGLTKNEILEELGRKRRVIEWFVRKGVRRLEDIGTIMRAYYLDQDEVYSAVDGDADPGRLLEAK
jgi:archaeal flagellar protein FlaI